MSNEVFDWAQHETPTAVNKSAVGHLELRPVDPINPVTGHGRDCECSRCPGWYLDRARLAAAAIEGAARPVTGPQERKPNVLADQVVPVSILLVVFTLCAMVLLPLIVPVLAVATVSVVAVVVSIVALAVVLMAFVGVARRARSDFGGRPGGPVVLRRPRRWRK